MFGYIVFLGIGWWTGRNWDLVKKLYNDKVKSKMNNAGNVTKVD